MKTSSYIYCVFSITKWVKLWQKNWLTDVRTPLKEFDIGT